MPKVSLSRLTLSNEHDYINYDLLNNGWVYIIPKLETMHVTVKHNVQLPPLAYFVLLFKNKTTLRLKGYPTGVVHNVSPTLETVKNNTNKRCSRSWNIYKLG